ncbi:MAG: hypothetical protein ABIJ47_06030 [Candidatus Bathyarchaeota archaeon]
MIDQTREIQQAINQITELGHSLQKIKGGSFPTDLLSVYGELSAYLELRKRFPNSEIKFKRKARADVEIDGIKIEIKTSNYKKEDYGEGYGFALHIKKCKQHPKAHYKHPRRGAIIGDFCYFDYLVCVAVNENNIENPVFYVFSKAEIEGISSEIENKSRRFWYSPYRILIPIKPDLKNKGVLYSDFDLEIANDKKKYKKRWDKIKTK